MATFVIVAVAPNATLDQNIVDSYASTSLRLSPTVCLVAEKGVTSQEVSLKLGVKPEGISGVIIFKIESYYGLASQNIWEWIKVKGAE